MLDHTANASEQIIELRREIEGIQELNAIYRSQRFHRHQDQLAHEKRMVRLEEILRQLAALRTKSFILERPMTGEKTKGHDERRLRVIDWVSSVPAIAVCALCAERFTVEHSPRRHALVKNVAQLVCDYNPRVSFTSRKKS